MATDTGILDLVGLPLVDEPTSQLPPAVLGEFPPGTLFLVDHEDGSVRLHSERE